MIGVPCDNVTHERLGNIAVHGVHGHVIGVIRAPAKCDFGKVTRSNDNAAFFICQVHQDLGAFASLYVFVSHIELCRIVTDVLEMLQARGLDVDCSEFNAQEFRHRNSIVLCAFGRAESRHCNHENFV